MMLTNSFATNKLVARQIVGNGVVGKTSMSVPRKYNPGFLTDEELVASFCVRTSEFDSMVEMLRECTGSSNPHQIVIGPRGSGKTNLLLRVAAEVRRDATLSSGFFPVVFAEESYEVATAGEFWLECLSRLADQAPHREGGPDLRLTLEDLRAIHDDRALGERCLAALLDFSDREGKRLVLMVENLNMMFGDMADSEAGWRLRKTLQTEPRIVMLASATSRFEEIDNPDRALYDLFRTVSLRPLATDECAVLWEKVSGQSAPGRTIRSLEILTGGSPRLLTIVARFGAGLAFRELMAELLDLVDEHTEYFKSHLESLPPQERRVYLALAVLWKPATAREVADRSRLDASKCSAQLARLIERGVVQEAGGTFRRKQYYLTERMYNIYYLLRRYRDPEHMIEALIRFMVSWYSLSELKDWRNRLVNETENSDAEIEPLLRAAVVKLDAILPKDSAESFGQKSTPSDLVKTPSIEVLLEHDQIRQLDEDVGARTELTAVKALIDKGNRLDEMNKLEEALVAYDEVLSRYGASNAPALLEGVAMALVNKGTILGRLERLEEALAACDEVISRYRENDTPFLLEHLAAALVNKGMILRRLNRLEEALAVYEEVVSRYGESETLVLQERVAVALVNKATILYTLHRSEEALAAYEKVVSRYGDSDRWFLFRWVATALVNKGVIFDGLNQSEEALALYDEMISRYGESDTPVLIEQTATAFFNKGATLGALNRSEEALAAYDEVISRYGEKDSPMLLERVATAFVNKGVILGSLNRMEEALVAYDEVVSRYGKSKASVLLERVATALFNKGNTLDRLNRTEEALAGYDEVLSRYDASETPILLEQAATALFNKATILSRLNRLEEALANYDEVVSRYGASDTLVLLELVVSALVGKGATLVRLDRLEEALAAYDEVVSRCGTSDVPALVELLADALVNKGNILVRLDRLEEVLAAYDDVVGRYGASDAPALVGLVANALVNKGAMLGRLNRLEEALAACDEVVSRYGEDDTPALLEWVVNALVNKATIRRMEVGGNIFAAGEGSSLEQDIETILAILPKLDSFPENIINGLMLFSVDLGYAHMRNLIQASASANLLLPLITALEMELGMQPRVAREVEEVARDVRQELAKLKKGRTGGTE